MKSIVLPTVALLVSYWGLTSAPAVNKAPAGPVEARALLDQVKLQMRAQSYEAAAKSLNLLLASEPDNHVYLRMLAEAQHEQKHFEEEAKAWERFIETAPLPEEACPQYGKAYRELGRNDETRKAFQKCFDLDPTNPDSILFLALSEERAGNYSHAAELYTAGVKSSPGYMDLRIGLARSQMQLGKYEPAIAAFDLVIRNYPKSGEVPDAYVRKGTALKTLRQSDAAREAFEFVIKNYADSVAATVAQQRLQELLSQKP